MDLIFNLELDISPYKAKIEQRLAEMRVTGLSILEMKKGIIPDPLDEFEIVDVAHYNDFTCELCDHYPIVNVFTLLHKQTGNIKKVGSECAKNWASTDLIQGMLRELNRQKRVIKNEYRYQHLYHWYDEFKHLVKDYNFKNLLNSLKKGKVISKKQKMFLFDVITKLTPENIIIINDKINIIKEENDNRFYDYWSVNSAAKRIKNNNAYVKDYLIVFNTMEKMRII